MATEDAEARASHQNGFFIRSPRTPAMQSVHRRGSVTARAGEAKILALRLDSS
jgi:hypothetical protein